MQNQIQPVTNLTSEVSLDVLNLDSIKELTIEEMKGVVGGGWNSWVSRSHPPDNSLDRDL